MSAQLAAERLGLKLIPVGSRVTCNPPPTDTDQDYLALTEPHRLPDIIETLVALGWQAGGSLGDIQRLDRATFRLGEDNLIVTSSRPFYDSFLACTEIAKRLNLLDKQDRVTLFATAREYWPGLEQDNLFQ